MFRDEFASLDRLVRGMGSSRWRKLAILRSTARVPGLDAEIDRLYAATTPDRIAALSEAEAEDWLRSLLALESLLVRIEQAIPFERKLRPIMRPFRHRFQGIIRLHNAVTCGIAVLRQRLHKPDEAISEPLKLAPAEILYAEDLIASRVPGWHSPLMEVYDHL